MPKVEPPAEAATPPRRLVSRPPRFPAILTRAEKRRRSLSGSNAQALFGTHETNPAPRLGCLRLGQESSDVGR